MGNNMIRKKISVYGSVQGVGFRYRAEHAANMLGVTGWVRNEPDGSVLLEMQGTEEQIDKVLALVNQGTYVNIDRSWQNRYRWKNVNMGFMSDELPVPSAPSNLYGICLGILLVTDGVLHKKAYKNEICL